MKFAPAKKANHMPGLRKTCYDPICYHNMKPYRTKAQKDAARKTAKYQADGRYLSPAPVSYHGAPKQEHAR